jgi:DNA sulfur modification protein DndD
MNGTGKTSLLVGLYLGLFGREAMQFVEGVKLGGSDEERFSSYKQLVQHLLHRPALETDDPHASVEIVFENSKRQIKVTRTWYFTRGGAPRDLTGEGEEVRLSIDGRPQRVLNWQDANNKIATELFPAHVMPCFFFDGEQAQERVEASGAAAMSEAIRVLFATGLLDELSESLKHYVANERSSAKRDMGAIDVDSLDRKRRRRDELQDEVSGIEKEFSKVRTDLTNAESARSEKILELTQITGDAAIDYAQLAQRKAELDSNERDVGDRLRESIANLALPMALAKLGGRIADQLKGEITRDRWQLLKDATVAKVDTIVAASLPKPGRTGLEPPLNAAQYKVLDGRLRTALESLWHPPPEGCADEFRFRFLQAPERVAALQHLDTLLASEGNDVGALAGEWEQAKARVRDAHRLWEQTSNSKPKIEQLRNRIVECDERIRELSGRKSNLDARLKGHQSELKDLQAAIGQMESVKRKLDPVEAKLDVAERVRSLIGDVRDDLIPLCKKSLEESCTKHFKAMISAEYRKYRVEFDQDLQPLLSGGPTPIYVTTLSGAQKRAFGLAFTLAVAEVSGEEAPLVIDTPVGNADSEYRGRMLEYLASSAPGQVIFLSHDEEIYGPYAEILKPYLLKSYLVSFTPVSDGAGVSSVVDDAYFGAGQPTKKRASRG